MAWLVRPLLWLSSLTHPVSHDPSVCQQTPGLDLGKHTVPRAPSLEGHLPVPGESDTGCRLGKQLRPMCGPDVQQ